MAPYVMNVEIENDTPFTISYQTWAAYPTDGSPEASGSSVAPHSTSSGVVFTKGGGTDGLFSGAFFTLPNTTPRIFVYTRMPASSGAQVGASVAITPGNDESIQQYVNNAEDNFVNRSPQYATQAGTVSGKPGMLSVELRYATNAYPNTSCKILVRAYSQL